MSTIPFLAALVDTVKSTYLLGEIVETLPLPSPRSHTAADDTVFKIVTNSGSYVLRHFRTDSAERIDLHNRFLIWADKTKFASTQTILPTNTGELYFQFANSKWWLANYIEAGQAFRWDDPLWTVSHCQHAGAALASLHAGLRQFAQKELIKQDKTTATILPLVEANLRQAFLAAPVFKNESQTTLRIVRKALEVIRRPEPRRLQLVHGDYHPGNVLWQESKAAVIIDFEYLHFEDLIYDVAYGLIMFCSYWSDTDADGALDRTLVQVFLRGYGKIGNDPLLLPYMRIASAVCLSWLLERQLDAAKARHFINVLNHLQNFSTIDFSP